MALIAQGITSGGILQANSSSDITAINDVQLLTVVGVHLENTADTLLLALSGVKHIRAGGKGTGIYAEECQLTNKWISHDLECQGSKWLAVAGRTMILLAGIRVYTLDWRDVSRCRHEVYNSVQHRLYTLVSVGSTAGNRSHGAGDSSLADGSLDLCLSDLLTAQILLHEAVVNFCNCFQQLLTVLLGKLLHIFRNSNLIGYLAQVILIHDGFHLDEVNDALEIILCADWQLDSNCIGVQTLLHHLDYIIEICTGNIHLIYISHTRYIIFLSLTPYGLSLRLNAAASSQNCYSTVQYSQRTLNLYSKVNVTWGINDVDTMILPMAGGSCGGNGNTTLLLLSHPVHGSCAFMNLTDFVIDTSVEENTLGSSSLTGIDVRHDTDVTSLFKGKLSSHYLSLLNYTNNITNDNERKPCWPQPSCEYLPSS